MRFPILISWEWYLAIAGIAEFARQWILLNRRAPFVPDSGRHELRLNVGGSAGHSGSWDVTINEGRLKSDFSGRIWEVQVDDFEKRSHERQKLQTSLNSVTGNLKSTRRPGPARGR